MVFLINDIFEKEGSRGMNTPVIKTLTRTSGARIDLYQWLAKGKVQGIIQILHGMAEHCLRYQPLADFLLAEGWHVIAHNHRGHGPNALHLGDFSGLADNDDGWDETVTDALAVSQDLRDQYPELPLILMGHSMGSFMAQHCVMRDTSGLFASVHYDGLVLCGSNLPNQLQISLLQPVISLEKFRLGLAQSSALITMLSFGNFNNRVKGKRTAFDWLSRDESEVDKYIHDPLCGFDCSVGFWKSFSQGMLSIKQSGIKKVDSSMPVYIISGAHDPVGEMGKGVTKLASMWREHGNPVRMHLYSEARHELFNETNRIEVFKDLHQWMQDIIKI